MNILWIPHTGWHISQRAHIFCRALASHHTIHVTDWVADFSTLRDYMSMRYLRNCSYRCYTDGAVTVHGIPRISPALYFPQLRRLNLSVFQHYVQQIIQKYQIEVVVGTYLIPPPVASRVVFDLFDENVSAWRAEGHQRLADEIEHRERAYFDHADVIVAASSVLKDKALAIGTTAPVVLIPNPIELAQFVPGKGAAFRSQFPEGKIIVGSVANYGKIVEIDLILDAAKLLMNEAILFYLAGSGKALAYGKRRAASEGISNIIFAGATPRSELPIVLDAFDIGLCIYDKTPMDDARSPMRLTAYSALGLPTVATGVEEIKRLGFPNVVTIEPTPESIVEGIHKAMRIERQQPANIRDFDSEYLVPRYEAVLYGRT